MESGGRSERQNPSSAPASSVTLKGFPDLAEAPFVRECLSCWAQEALRAVTGTERECGQCVSRGNFGRPGCFAGARPCASADGLVVLGPLWL